MRCTPEHLFVAAICDPFTLPDGTAAFEARAGACYIVPSALRSGVGVGRWRLVLPAWAFACAPTSPVDAADGECRELQTVADSPPADVVPADWRAAVAEIERQLVAADARYDVLDLKAYVGRATVSDTTPSYGWPSNHFEGEVVALVEHMIPVGGRLDEEVWTLGVFDIEDELFVEVVQRPASPGQSEASYVSALRVSGGLGLTCSDCFPDLADVYVSGSAIREDVVFSGETLDGMPNSVALDLDLEAAEIGDLGVVPVWLSNFHHEHKRGDEMFELELDGDEVVLRRGVIGEPFPVPTDVPFDECERSIDFTMTAYVSAECPERYGVRDLVLQAPIVCCYKNCFHCSERYCFDPAEHGP